MSIDNYYFFDDVSVMENIVLVTDIVKKIEDLVEEFDLDYIDAVTYFADTHGVEIEVLAEVIKAHEPIKAKIQLEAENLNFLKKTKRLPI